MHSDVKYFLLVAFYVFSFLFLLKRGKKRYHINTFYLCLYETISFCFEKSTALYLFRQVHIMTILLCGLALQATFHLRHVCVFHIDFISEAAATLFMRVIDLNGLVEDQRKKLLFNIALASPCYIISFLILAQVTAKIHVLKKHMIHEVKGAFLVSFGWTSGKEIVKYEQKGRK